MKVIGFANKYHTLWNVSKPYKEYVDKYSFYWKTDYFYVQNLAFDLEKAKSKIEGYYKVDLTLRGTHDWTHTSNLVKKVPENVFSFGSHEYELITECENLKYVKWYYDETKSKVARDYLIDNGYILYGWFVEGEYYSSIFEPEYFKRFIEKVKHQNYVESFNTGYHFEDGSKVEIEIKTIDSFGFEGNYGYTHIILYGTKDGDLVKYIGTTPKMFDEYTKVRTTIKHTEYEGKPETHLKRIKIL